MKKTITWVLYILMGVQILLGCAYFVGNFGAEQKFAENMAVSLPMGLLCLVQLSFAAISVWYVLGRLGFQDNNYLRGYVCAYLLTVPFLLQMHMARLIWSFALSAFLWMTGLLLELLEEGWSTKRILLLAAAYMLYGILCPDGLWLGGILLLAVSFFGSRGKAEERKSGNGKLRFRVAVFLTAGMIFLANLGLNSAFPEERGIYRTNNIGTAVVSRFVWPNFGKNYFFWSEEIKAVLPVEDAVKVGQRIDLIEEEFYPRLVEAYGRKRATGLCVEMGLRCLKDRTRETVSEIEGDLLDYFLLPFTIGENLKGTGDSLTAWNYGRMREHTPILVKYYYRYGFFELSILLLGSLLLWCFQNSDRTGRFLKERAEKKEVERGFNKMEKGRKLPAQWKVLLSIWILYAVWYTVKSNFPVDYKLGLPILFIWYLAAAGGLLCQKKKS